MQMSFSPEYKHFFVKLREATTKEELTLFRAVSDPGAAFEETYDMMSSLADVLGRDMNIFETCFKAIPADGIRSAMTALVENAPSLAEVSKRASQDFSDPVERQEVIDAQQMFVADLKKACALPDAELIASVRLVSIEMGNPGEGFRVSIGWGPQDIVVLMCFIPSEAVELTPEELAEAQTMVVGEDGNECPYCASGMPHPEGMDMPGEHAPEPDAPKRTLH